jgi:hypothetical protein
MGSNLLTPPLNFFLFLLLKSNDNYNNTFHGKTVGRQPG